MHRDLKLANIYLHNDEIVIGDFGFSRIGVSFAQSKVGTPFYMAPEVLNPENRKFYNDKCDIWSMGICFYFMIFGILPYPEAKNKISLLNLVYKYSGDRLRFYHRLS